MYPPDPLLFFKTRTLSYKTRFSFSKPDHYRTKPAQPAEPARLGKPRSTLNRCWGTAHVPTKPAAQISKTRSLSYKTRCLIPKPAQFPTKPAQPAEPAHFRTPALPLIVGRIAFM